LVVGHFDWLPQSGFFARLDRAQQGTYSCDTHFCQPAGKAFLALYGGNFKHYLETLQIITQTAEEEEGGCTVRTNSRTAVACNNMELLIQQIA
jgi:hypothetical protein